MLSSHAALYSPAGASGNTLNEALCINTSLHFLEMVIVALQEREKKGRQHIPYRNSLLTSVPRDSLQPCNPRCWRRHP